MLEYTEIILKQAQELFLSKLEEAIKTTFSKNYFLFLWPTIFYFLSKPTHTSFLVQADQLALISFCLCSKYSVWVFRELALCPKGTIIIPCHS